MTPYDLGYRDGRRGHHGYNSSDDWSGYQWDAYEEGYVDGNVAERDYVLDMVSEGHRPQTPRTRWLAGGGW